MPSPQVKRAHLRMTIIPLLRKLHQRKPIVNQKQRVHEHLCEILYFRFRVGDAESPSEESSSEDDYAPTPKKVTPKKTPSKPETKNT